MTAGGVTPLTPRQEVTRKALHLSWAVIPLLYAIGVDRTLLVILLAASCLIAVLVEVGRSRVTRVGEMFVRLAGPLLRAHEHHRWSGATWLLIAFAVLVALFPAPIAIAAMWAISVGDASAALVGQAIGGYRLFGSGKTLAGSAACVLTTAFGGYVIAELPITQSLFAGVLAGVAEWPSGPMDDNIRIGLVVATGILLSHMAFS